MPRPNVNEYATAESRRKGAQAANKARSENAKSFRQKLADRLDENVDDVIAVYLEAMKANRSLATKDGDLLEVEDHPTRIRAADSAIDQAFGKPAQSVELSGPDGDPIEVVDVRQRLADRIAGRAARRGTPPDPG